jgi:hypothetical protein
MLGNSARLVPGEDGRTRVRAPLVEQGFAEALRAVATMSTREAENDDRERDRDVERYRLAALEALNQLEWCIDYLYGQRKAQIARAISRNRSQIIKRAGL